eukprot:GEZU01023950.1.p1 GENE.GEZU01023950.1~~GEZU01023950.1.p1  ORF type:complete len:277 (+),score=40.81 GEZU01023950.1:32-832(+)
MSLIIPFVDDEFSIYDPWNLDSDNNNNNSPAGALYPRVYSYDAPSPSYRPLPYLHAQQHQQPHSAVTFERPWLYEEDADPFLLYEPFEEEVEDAALGRTTPGIQQQHRQHHQHPHRTRKHHWHHRHHPTSFPPGYIARAAHSTFVPKRDVTETRNNLEIYVELPGVRKDDVIVEVDKGIMYIRGEARASSSGTDDHDDQRFHHALERNVGRFSRALRLPYPFDTVEPHDIEASLDNGILAITIPKSKLKTSEEGSRPFKVPIHELA